jgi:hypothetical protein
MVKATNAVFKVSGATEPEQFTEALGTAQSLVDGWGLGVKKAPIPDDPGVFVVPMGRVVGTAGEKSIINMGSSDLSGV